MRTAIDEILRWTRRRSTSVARRRESELRGAPHQGRRQVTYWEMSANRDAGRVRRAFRFDIARSPNRHVAFGFGVHVCLGASLARMEIRLAFAELLARIETFKAEGPIDWMLATACLESATCR